MLKKVNLPKKVLKAYLFTQKSTQKRRTKSVLKVSLLKKVLVVVVISGLLIKAEQSFIIHFPIFNAQKVNCIDPNLQV